MNSKVTKHLLSLSEVDKDYFAAMERKSALERHREMSASDLQERRQRLGECEVAFKEGTLKQVLEEHRLRDEEKKIVERRKQISAMGGAKGAKVMEREVDIASRTLQAMEERALKAMEETAELEAKLNELRTGLEQQEAQFEEEAPKIEAEVANLDQSIAALKKDRQKNLSNLDDRLARLYERVTTRYPGSAIAYAKNGSCRSCFRALPHQTYNQILAGNALIQCPGCSRILVYLEDK